jgi:hypothetical protein
MPTITNWRAAANVLVAANDEPRLWLDGDGQLRDSLGVVKKFEPELSAVTPFELASYVAEWLVWVTDKDGPTAYSDIRADLRAAVYQLAPSAITMSDDDEASFISDGTDR